MRLYKYIINEKTELTKFRPPSIVKKDIDIISFLRNITGKNFCYFSKGEYALTHLVESQSIKGPILLPAYVCKTVADAILFKNIKIIYYDFDPDDFNACLESVKYLSKKYQCDSILVASLYGNPANLVEIELFAKESNIILIDDAAQSFGSRLDGKLVGTFGNAGFFSFSPGKNTAGHMGAYAWSDKPVEIDRSHHCLIHYIIYLDFLFNRYYSKNIFTYLPAITFNVLKKIALRIISIRNDECCRFETPILGGILYSLFDNSCNFKRYWLNSFVNKFKNASYFKIIISKRGESLPNKIVLLCNNQSGALELTTFLKSMSIYSGSGYTSLDKDAGHLDNVNCFSNSIIELPIENSDVKMNYLFKCINEFLINHES